MIGGMLPLPVLSSMYLVFFYISCHPCIGRCPGYLSALLPISSMPLPLGVFFSTCDHIVSSPDIFRLSVAVLPYTKVSLFQLGGFD